MDAVPSADLIPRHLWSGFAEASGEPVGATIIIPTYQSEATLARAIRSALGQTMRDIEVIVADDGSTDCSWRLIAEWPGQDRRLRAFRTERNLGKSAVMNCATYAARGRWLAVLDADDWYHRERLASLVAIGESRDVAAVADNQFLYDALADAVVGPAWPIGNAAWQLTFDD